MSGGFSQAGEFFIGPSGIFVPGGMGGFNKEDFNYNQGVLPFGPSIDLNFAAGQYFGVSGAPAAFLTTTRASVGTDLLPSSSSGLAYNTFPVNTPRITLGIGLLVEEARTNSLLNSNAPATQTTASLGTGTYTLWVNGAGSATSAAGTATGSGFGAATNGTPNVFTLSGAGTVVVTVSGALNAFQLEAGTFGTSFIVTAGAVVTRATDVISLTSSPVYGGAYTLFGIGTPMAPITSAANQVVIQADDNSASNRVNIARAAGTGVGNGGIVSGGTNMGVSTVNVWAQNTAGKLACSETSGNLAVVLNGSTVATAAAALPIGVSTTRIGSNQASAAFFNGPITRVALWLTTFLTGPQLQALTT